MTTGQYFRLIVRESRRSLGRIGLFIACICIGVAAIVVVDGLSTSVTQGVRAEGRRLMAADVSIEGRRPLPDELDAAVAKFHLPVQRSNAREFVSIVLAPDQADKSQLAELKVVEAGYPFYGQVKLDPPGELQSVLSADTVVVAPELLTRMGLKVGDKIRIGGVDFTVGAAVTEEPDKLTITFTLGPRIFLSPAAIERTALLDRGARVEYRALFKLPDGASADDASQLKSLIQSELAGSDFYRVRMFTEAQPALRRGFERIDRYLGLVGLLSLLVGAIGVAQVSRIWLASRTDDIAIMRCVGMKPNQVVMIFAVQVIFLALVGSAVGAALGTAFHWLIPQLLPNLLPEELIHPWQPTAMLRGTVLGVFVAMLFTLPILIGLRRVPPIRVLRRDAEAAKSGRVLRIVTALVIIGGILAAAAVQADSLRYGAIFTSGLLGAVVLLVAVAWLMSGAMRLLPRDTGGFRLRHGLAQLARPGAGTVGAIVALGLGVTFIFATRVVERHLSSQLKAELPADAPSTFMLDVQPDQWEPLRAMLQEQGAIGIDSQPIITARFAAINGVPINKLTGVRRQGGGGEGRSPRWALTREQRITYGNTLPRGNQVIEGHFRDPAHANGISIEESFARDIGVGIGSTITLDVQGVLVDLIVTSLRTIDWRTFGINFFLYATPGPLDEAPQQRVAVARIPAGRTAAAQAQIVQAFPNITVIQIRDVMDKVLVILNNLALAVRSLGAFIVVAGAVVLGGTVAATQARRSREMALLKAIGMTRRDVVLILAIEYALIGAVAAAIGIAAGSLLAWGVLTRLMELPWSPGIGEMGVAFGVTIALTIAAGLVASLRSLAVRPLAALRAD